MKTCFRCAFLLLGLSTFVTLLGCGGSKEPVTASQDEVKAFLDQNPDLKNPAPPSEAGSFKLD